MHNPRSSLVSTQWLSDNLGNENVVILDASHHLPAANRNPQKDFETAHIPGARFLDLASFIDPNSSTPAALPDCEQVSARLASLGVGPKTHIVIYDDSDVKTSARAWFALTSQGVGNVTVLDGGMGKWRDEERAIESGKAQFNPARPLSLCSNPAVRTKKQMLDNLAHQKEQVLDARRADRVFGTGVDPVHGGQNGRIPGALNLPFGQVLADDGTFRSTDELRAAFESSGIDLARPIVCSCGSGITASVLLFALHLIGHEQKALYDGSWQEWEADPDTPKAQGADQGSNK